MGTRQISGYYTGIQFKTLKRASPTCTVYAVSGGSETAGVLIDFGSGSSLGSASIGRINASGVAQLTATDSTNGTIYRLTSDAEL